MTSNLSIGILGAGFAAKHVQHLLSFEDVTVSAVCATTQENAGAFIEKMGAKDAAGFGDFDEMLAKTKLDALYVCIPPHAHRGQVEKAAGRGIHLFLEKPIAWDTAGAERQAEAIERAGVVSLVGYHHRFRKSVEVFKALIDSGAGGRASIFQGRYWCNMLGSGWWRSSLKSRGQVFEQVIHLYDMACYLMGEPESVCAFSDNLVHRHIEDYSIEDTSASIIRFKNDALASIVGSNTAIPGRYLADFRVVYENAVLDYRSEGQDGAIPPQAVVYEYPGESMTTCEITETRDPHLEETREFLAAVRRQAVSRTPVRDGVLGIRLVSAVLESAKNNGKLVAV
jgi:predicted dehydrogenase